MPRMRRPLRLRRVGVGDGGVFAVKMCVNAVTRWILVYVAVCMQGSSYWQVNNNYYYNSDDVSSTTSTFLMVEANAFFRPLDVLSSVFMGGERSRRTLPSTTKSTSATAQAARTETDDMNHDYEDDENSAIVDLQHHQQATQTEQEEEEEEHSSQALADTDDEMHNEIIENNNNITIDRSNSSGGNNNEEKDEEEVSWFHDMEFEDYNNVAAEAMLASETSGGARSSSSTTSTTTALDDSQLHPMLQIPLAVSLNHDDDDNINNHIFHNNQNKNPIRAIRAYCDSGATRTVMSYESGRRLGWLKQLDRRYAGQATSVGGSCRVLGRLPAGLVNFHLSHHNRDYINDNDRRMMITLQSPTITVLEDLPSSSTTASCDENDDDDGNGGFELLLGLDFLREHQAILDLRNEELRLLVKNKEYSIPFLRPRSSSSTSSVSARGCISSCDAAHDHATAFQENGRDQETSNNEHKWGEFFRGIEQSLFDDDHDDDDDDDFEKFDETLDMSGV